MYAYNIRIYNLARLNLLWLSAFILPALILLPVYLATENGGLTFFIVLLLLAGSIWVFRTVTSTPTQWTIADDGFSISKEKPNRFFPLEDQFIRWDDITGFDETSHFFRSDKYLGLNVYTYSGNDMEVYAYYYNEDLENFMAAFRSAVLQKSPYLQSEVAQGV